MPAQAVLQDLYETFGRFATQGYEQARPEDRADEEVEVHLERLTLSPGVEVETPAAAG